MKRLLIALALAWLLAIDHASAAELSTVALLQRRVHLRSGEEPEWDSFAASKPDARRLDLTFQAHSNGSPATLFIRQDDVRQEWTVEVNGRKLGNLFTMEADLVHSLAVPVGWLLDGTNRLAIVPPKTSDDILIHSIMLDPRSPAAAKAEATLRIQVHAEASHEGIPCRITIVNREGSLAPLMALTNASANSSTGAGSTPRLPAIRPGVAYTGDGVADLGVLAGVYTIFASRGFEWSVATQSVEVAAGDTRSVRLELRREVDTRGWVSCDTHVHTFTHSRHGDCTVEERMLTLAGEGIELPVATDHNLHIDYAPTARETRTERYFTPITGNEVTTAAGHFNIFPVRPEGRVPDFRITDWPTLMNVLRGTPDVRVVILNHPRNVHNGFQPFAATNFNALTGENLRGPEFTFDAMEVMNSSAQQSDYMLVYRDWFALLNHGYQTTTVGSSDCHDVSRYIVGQGRSYIATRDEEPGRLDIAAACSNLLAGHAMVSMGLLPQIRVNDQYGPGDLATHLPPDVQVTVHVLGPSWVTATNVSLFANGTLVAEKVIEPPAGGVSGVRGVARWTLPRASYDRHLVAIATGPGVTAPFWAIPKPYQPVSRAWTGRVIGSTNPVWLDQDGDGRFTSPREYARRVVKKASGAPMALVRELRMFDESIAVQAAALSADAGASLTGPEFVAALKTATPAVQRAFAAVVAAKR